MKTEDVTQAILMRCRGAAYQAIGEVFGLAHSTIRVNLSPLARREKRSRDNARDRKLEGKAYYNRNRSKKQQQRKRHYELNRAKVIAQVSEYRRTNPQARIAANIRRRTNLAARGVSGLANLGCSIEELRDKLEAQFEEGMSWDNYGEWHIDHVRPLAKFDLLDPEQIREACHFSNLQPLWAEDNLRKGAKV